MADCEGGPGLCEGAGTDVGEAMEVDEMPTV